MNRTTVIIIGVLILCFGGFVAWSITHSGSESKTVEYDSTTIIQPSTDNGEIGDHARGYLDSPVIVIEYADFQCPGCASIHPKTSTLFEEYGDRVAFVFRNFPIKSHPNARASASAVEAAGLQGYFFEMAEIVFANQAVWSYANGSERTNIFVELFQQVTASGNIDQFKSDMVGSRVSKKINFDFDLGNKKDNVTGTPFFLVNGVHIDLSNSTTSSDFFVIMREKIDAKLAEFDLPTGPNTRTEETK